MCVCVCVHVHASTCVCIMDTFDTSNTSMLICPPIICVQSQVRFAQSAGAVEYTKWFSTEEYDSPINVLDMTINNHMVRFQ